jgi:hydroxymethylbilane synthase
MTKRHLIIATRESPLALRQAVLIQEELQKHHPHLAVELLGMTTQADKRLDMSLIEMGGKGVFVKELEEALLDGRADIAVHSMKDVPMELPPGLCIPVMSQRAEPRDAFVSNQYHSLSDLPSGAVVGTSSLRRQTQLRAWRSDLNFQSIRGNVQTRLKRLDEGHFDALILAAAGLIRVHLAERIRQYLSIEQSLPAAGQGALGVECREDDARILELLAPINHPLTYDCVRAERALCRKLNGGCKVPIAAYAQIHHERLSLEGLVANQAGTRILRVQHAGHPTQAEDIGMRAAEELLQQGAEKILKEFIKSEIE